MQMIRIRENHRRPRCLELRGIEGLHRRERTDGHEGRSVDDTVRRAESSSSRVLIDRIDDECELPSRHFPNPWREPSACYTTTIESPYEYNRYRSAMASWYARIVRS